MPNLYAIMLGGRAEGCNTELHDTVFVTGNSIEETYPKLIEKWFGIPYRLHIDICAELKYIDGYEIKLSQNKPNTKPTHSLYFINFGGYKPDYFGEIHQSRFYVGTSKTEILKRAKKELCLDTEDPHCDDNIEIDDLLHIDQVDQYYLTLTPTDQDCKLKFKAEYHPINL